MKTKLLMAALLAIFLSFSCSRTDELLPATELPESVTADNNLHACPRCGVSPSVDCKCCTRCTNYPCTCPKWYCPYCHSDKHESCMKKCSVCGALNCPGTCTPLAIPPHDPSFEKLIELMNPTRWIRMESDQYNDGWNESAEILTKYKIPYGSDGGTRCDKGILPVPPNGMSIDFAAAYCINRHLNVGRPIMAKVLHRPSNRMHWVVITGKHWKSDENIHYTYMDPLAPNAAAGCDLMNNRLIFDPGYNGGNDYAFYDNSAPTGGSYQLVEIRANDKIPAAPAFCGDWD